MNDNTNIKQRPKCAYASYFSRQVLSELLSIEDESDNILISPARLQAVLVLLANWASPAVREEILRIVGNGVTTLDEANVLSSKAVFTVTPNEWFKDEEGDCVPVIEQQTTLWAQRELHINQEALKKLSDYFAMTLKMVDFTRPGVKEVMDEVVNKATHGLIKQLGVEPTAETTSVITDILYFKAAWENAFDEDDTKDQLFHGTKGNTKVPMMKMTEHLDYHETSVFQMVKLPYTCISKERLGFSMRVCLPKAGHNISDILSELRKTDSVIIAHKREVALSLPRFSVESDIKMGKLFEKMGLSFIFKSTDIIPNCIKGLQIEQIAQQAKVTVDEQGTEAAAVTTVAMCGCLPPMEKPKPIVMRVNHPFLFEIAEETTNTILFAGIVYNI